MAAKTTPIFSSGLIGLHLAGLLFPGAFTWGFHFLAFLPVHAAIIYLIIFGWLGAGIDKLGHPDAHTFLLQHGERW